MLQSVRAHRLALSTWFAALVVIGSGSWGTVCGDDEIGVKVPPGFSVTKYADDTLAHDIFSMTLDSAGRVVVSGEGYVKILVDSDGDGKADRAKTFVDGPQSGAQGMYFLGRDLLCTGDAGLIRYRDTNGDDKADGPPETFLKIKTGSEHNAHAIRHGPDGWWYLIAGNTADVTGGYATLKTSPIKHPYAGTVMRLKPDLSGGEILADGFRNAYDFDFDQNGEIYSHDSDGEREISLPWYLPTRAFHILPGAHHGWVTESWKWPDYFFDAPPVVASTGRGSPTGIATYRHTQFPAQYRNSLFLLDWTFGRILCVPLKRQGDTFAGEPQEFMTTLGQFGFAPTDVEVGIDGSLYVCVGGRGTHGTVYRITYTGDKNGVPAQLVPSLKISDTAPVEEKLKFCLDAPQPLSSWSRAKWEPVAKKLGSQPFLMAAVDEQFSDSARIRAIEILTEIFTGLPRPMAEILSKAKSPELRARAAWSLGVKRADPVDSQMIADFLVDSDPLVRRRALEAVATSEFDKLANASLIGRCMNDDYRLVRLAAARLVPQMDAPTFKKVSDAARTTGWKAALTNALGFVWRAELKESNFNAYAVDIGRRILDGNHPLALKLEATRLIQAGLGDLGSVEKNPPVFDGYTSLLKLAGHERELDPVRASLGKIFPTGDPKLDLELARLAAIIMPPNADLLTKVLAQVTEKSDPIDDIHYLIAASRIPVPRTKPQQAAIAKALVQIEPKIIARKLSQDNDWNDRVMEMYAQLVTHDPKLPVELLKEPGFGRPGHVIFLSKLPETELENAINVFAKVIEKDAEYPWNNDLVFLFGSGNDKSHDDLLRKQFEKFELRMAVLLVLTEEPEEQDRQRFVAGLEMIPIEVLTACVDALGKLPPKKDGEVAAALVKLLRRLGEEKTEFPLREKVVALLKPMAGDDFGFIAGANGYKPQPEVMEKWTAWVTKTYPNEAARQLGETVADLDGVKALLKNVEWDKGDAERGRKLYGARGCAQCHGAGTGLGPDLAGAAGRFSREDLFVAIALPNRDVSPRYQTTLVETKAGKTYTGLIVYESVDGVLLRNSTNQTFRIEGGDIETKRNLSTSIMPSGLLKDLKPGDLADLYSYLKSLNVQTADAGSKKQKE